ncbi:MAG TPA: RNA polymerase sigma factor, partial [Emticicia sp.]
MTEPTQNFWETAYKQNIGKMLGICYRYVRDKQIAEDLAHDAFLNAIDKSSTYKGEGHFDAWLRKIAVNEALQYLREQKKKEYHNEWMQYENENMETHEEMLTMDFSEAELLDAINQLPEHHKMVFNLYVIDKFSHAEIAQELGINENTSKSHLARARKKIRKILLEKKDKKQTVWALFLPFKRWNIDKTYQKAFLDFEIEPTHLLTIDTSDSPTITLPKFNPHPLVLKNFINAGIALGSVAVGLFTVLILLEQEPKTEADKKIANYVKPTEFVAERVANSDNQDSTGIFIDNHVGKLNTSKNSDSLSATIANNPIIADENNLKSTDMKRLNTVGALLLAGAASMGFDSSKNQEIKFGSGLKLPKIQLQQLPQENDFVLKRKEGEGVFNASKILWS